MKRTTERRVRLLVTLCRRGHNTVYNLAFEFHVDEHTIRNDINALSLDFPVYTICGRHGGVFIDENYRLGMQYLTEKEQTLLEKLLLILSGEEQELMRGILQKFTRPRRKK